MDQDSALASISTTPIQEHYYKGMCTITQCWPVCSMLFVKMNHTADSVMWLKVQLRRGRSLTHLPSQSALSLLPWYVPPWAVPPKVCTTPGLYQPGLNHPRSVPPLVFTTPCLYHPRSVPPQVCTTPGLYRPRSVPPPQVCTTTGLYPQVCTTPGLYHPRSVPPKVCTTPGLYHPRSVPPQVCTTPGLYHPRSVPPQVCTTPGLYHPRSVPPQVCTTPSVYHPRSVPLPVCIHYYIRVLHALELSSSLVSSIRAKQLLSAHFSITPRHLQQCRHLQAEYSCFSKNQHYHLVQRSQLS